MVMMITEKDVYIYAVLYTVDMNQITGCFLTDMQFSDTYYHSL